MPLQRIQNNFLTVSYVGQSGQIETTKYRDNLFNKEVLYVHIYGHD